MAHDLEMEEIHKVFFEESFEGLDVMESSLLVLDADSSLETINTIFRAAHSIKGGAATFDFAELARFTHGVETLLDQMRNGERKVTAPAVQLLLRSVDCMRAMVRAAQAGAAGDPALATEINGELAALLASSGQGSASAAAASARWEIGFRPGPDMLKLRNEPSRMFAELARLGPLRVVVDDSRLPDLHELDPEACHLGWHLVLEGEVDRARIEEVFDWVSGAAEITYQRFPEEPATEATPGTAATAEPAVATPSSAAAPAAVVPGGKGETNSMRVSTEKVDALLNLVGELVITQSMLSRFGERMDASQIDALREGLAQLTRNTRELQESVMQIRMLPISFSFNRFPRLVHDLSRRLGKQVELKLIGEGTELDKTVLEKIGDPLVHLVRNALDHGIESPAVRLAAGKSATGLIELNAHHEGGSIVVEVRDDGAGLNRARILAKARERGLVGANDELSDEQVQNLIFAPGFSTADQVSDVSGRGVGMDVVRRNITDLGGHVHITSVEGKGSTVRIRLPLTLAILDGQLVRCGSEIYIISLVAIVETIQIGRERLSAVAGRTELFRLRDEYLPIVRLHEQFGVEPDSRDPSEGLLVVVESDGTRVGILVDDLLAQQQVVIKSLETNFRQVEGLAGATILGDGTVAPIIDVPGLIRSFARSQRTRAPHAMAAA